MVNEANYIESSSEDKLLEKQKVVVDNGGWSAAGRELLYRSY